MKVIVLITSLAINGLFQTAPSPVKNEQQHNKKEAKPAGETRSSTTEPTSPITAPVGQPTPNSQTSDTKEKPGSWPPWTDIFWPTWILVIVTGFAVGAALKTLGAINAQVVEMRETGVQTDKLIAENIEQSKSMQQSVAEAARLASAMEIVANEIAVSSKAATESVVALRERTAQQMRAYLCVIIGGGTYQHRASNLKFAASPTLINAGHTPAHKVSYRAKAEILPVPLPDDFAFPLPDEAVGGSLLGPQQNATLNGVVDDFCADEEVEDIKAGKGKALYIWGIVNYKDVFGESHFTKFCQTVHFMRIGAEHKITGFFIPRYDEAN
jgi:hypothetical protein